MPLRIALFISVATLVCFAGSFTRGGIDGEVLPAPPGLRIPEVGLGPNRAPIAARVWLETPEGTDEISPRDHKALDALFEHEIYVSLPGEEKVRVLPNGAWDYPEGTRISHFILLKGPHEKSHPFEWRSIQKIRANSGSDTWEYALHIPETQGAVPQWRQVETDAHEPVREVLLPGHATRKLRYKRINTQLCQRCHFHQSRFQEHYPTVESAGPCEFGEGHPSLKSAATQQYLFGKLLFSQNFNLPFARLSR